MRLLTLAALAVAIMAVTGCQTPNQMAATKDTNTCTEYGYTPGTEGFANCRLSLAQTREAKNQQFINGLAILNATYNRPRPMVTCTSMHSGVFTNTNCF